MALTGGAFPLSRVSYRAYRIWQRNRDIYVHQWKTQVWPPFIEPVLNILALGIGLGAYVTDIAGLSYIQFIAPGFIASSAMFSATFTCTFGSFIRMKFQKTFDAILATPASLEDVVTGEILWGATRSLITATVVLIVIAVFGLVVSPWALLVPAVSLMEGLLFASLAMVVTSLVPSIDHFTYYFTLGITPMFLFSGIFFPLDRLPEMVQGLAWALPLTHVVNLHRGLILGRLSVSLLFDALWVLLVVVVLLNVALVLMRRRVIS
jgi:lipooligosaccharide transport system permease protein